MERVRKRARWGLKGRLVLLTLVVGTVPLLLGIGMAYMQGTRELQIVIGSSFAGLATETARKLDLVFSDEIAQSARIARDPLIVEAVSRVDGSETLSAPHLRAVLDVGARRWDARAPALVEAITEGPVADRLRQYAKVPAATRSLMLTDAIGRLVASINQDVKYVNRDYAWWRKAAHEAKPDQSYLGKLYFERQLGIYAVDLSTPITAGGRTIGVLHRVFDAKAYLDPSLAPVRFGETGHVMLIDSEGTVLSCPILPTGARLTDQELVRLVTPPEAGWARTPSDGHGSQVASIVGFSILPETSRMTQQSTGTAWHTFAWQSSQELFAPTRHLFAWISVFGLVAIGLLGTLGYFAAVRIVTPIRRLQEGAALIGRNELKGPISVRTGDEIEQLADEINRMNVRLQRAFSGLTQEVAEKTEEVRSLQEYNEKILDSVPNPIIMLDEERVQYANRAAKQAFRLGGGTERGADLFELIGMETASRERLRAELRTYTRDSEGSNAAIDRASSDGGRSLQPYDPLSPRQIADVESPRRELTIDHGTYRYDLFPVNIPSTGKRWIGLVLRDTTGESRLQDELIQAEKLAGLGLLTSGIGHELNNPLFGILSLGEAIRDEKDAARMKDYARTIVGHAQRMAGIIKDFAGSAHPDASDFRIEIDVNEQLDQALRVVGLMNVVAGLKVQRRYLPIPKIRAVPEEIGQIFLNVITNGIQAMKGKGTIELATSVSAGMIAVKIRDSGPGIPKIYASKIFDPFFTTKAPGQGTGLGLTIARRIVLRYGGQIQVQTAEGEGATFIVTFPVDTKPE